MTAALWQLDAVELSALTRSGKVSCREVVQSTLDRLHSVNPVVNAITLSLDESALAQADAADSQRSTGAPLGPLFGVPFTTKINTDQVGCPTDDGLINFVEVMPKMDSPLVARMREAGGIPIGRTNSPAFGLVQNAINLLHGETRNPWDRKIMCGGSSGGAAVAVSTGIGPIAQGNDLAGSVRWPALCNGVIGLRPSPGLIPYYNSSFRGGMIFCEQLMTVHGPITRTVGDARLALKVMAGVDAHDPVTVPVDVFGSRPPVPKRVALLKGRPGKFNDEFQACTQQAVQRAGEILAAAGYVVEELATPSADEVLELFDAIVWTELVNKLQPLLGKFVDPYMAGSLNMAANSTVDLARYLAALRERDHVIRKWQLFMETYPLVVMAGSTSPDVPVLTIDNVDSLIRSTARCLSHLRLAPLLGFPAISVPVSVTPEAFGGRPLGVDIMAPRYRDDLCLEAAEVIELHEGKRQPIDPQWH